MELLEPGVAAYFLGPAFDAVDLAAVGGWLTELGFTADPLGRSFWGTVLGSSAAER